MKSRDTLYEAPNYPEDNNKHFIANTRQTVRA